MDSHFGLAATKTSRAFFSATLSAVQGSLPT